MTATTTLPTVESYAKKYPDIPKEVILKEDLLRLGLNITKDAMELSKGCREQAYYLFSYGGVVQRRINYVFGILLPDWTPPAQAEGPTE